MVPSPEDRQLLNRMRRVESLLQDIDQSQDHRLRSSARQLVQTLMEMHEAGLTRMLQQIDATGDAGAALIDSLARDELIASLFLLHGLHPLSLEQRVHEALVKVRPYLASHGGNVELLGIEDGVVRLQLQGSCHGCPSSAVTLRQTIEEAILEQAPDASGIVVEGDFPAAPPPVETATGRRHALPIVS